MLNVIIFIEHMQTICITAVPMPGKQALKQQF